MERARKGLGAAGPPADVEATVATVSKHVSTSLAEAKQVRHYLLSKQELGLGLRSSGSQERWFDRLAAGHHTRRQALGAAIAGAAALTLPFLRPALARADAGTCTKGCLYTIHYDGVAAFTACDKQSAFSDS